MLNKKICKKCIEKERNFWGKLDEEVWRGNLIVCPSSIYLAMKRSLDNYGYISRKEDAPDWCPFYLEHIISEKRERNA